MKRTDQGKVTWTLSPDTVCRITQEEIKSTDPDAADIDLEGGIIETYADGSITYSVRVERDVDLRDNGS